MLPGERFFYIYASFPTSYF